MSLFDDPPLHDFPDRAIRRLLENPANLRDLLAALLPDLVDRLDFERAEVLGREFLLEDWRRRENDLLFRLPFRTDPGIGAAASGGFERARADALARPAVVRAFVGAAAAPE